MRIRRHLPTAGTAALGALLTACLSFANEGTDTPKAAVSRLAQVTVNG